MNCLLFTLHCGWLNVSSKNIHDNHDISGFLSVHMFLKKMDATRGQMRTEREGYYMCDLLHL
nr:MAG TPA: hypothetical protein [Bacteriophage sp.]